jgi:hypothetical protein
VSLSSISATTGGVQLVFTGALDTGTALDMARYEVRANGRTLPLESSQMVRTGTVTLTLEAGSLHAGDTATITYDLQDTHGNAVRGTALVGVR